MIRASRASTFALFGVLLASGVTLAQAPTPLRPPVQTDTAPDDAQTPTSITAGPLRLTPKVSRPLATERTETSSGSTAASLLRSVVQVEGLTEIDPNSVGSLTPENGGLGLDMWRHAAPSYRTPDTGASQRRPLSVVAGSNKRLLLSAATLPAWEDKPAEPTGPSLIVTRLRKLQAMGAFKNARELTKLTPTRMQDPTLLQLQADNRLLANDYGNACQIVDGAIDHLARLYWQQLLVLPDPAGRPRGCRIGCRPFGRNSRLNGHCVFQADRPADAGYRRTAPQPAKTKRIASRGHAYRAGYDPG